MTPVELPIGKSYREVTKDYSKLPVGSKRHDTYDCWANLRIPG